MYLDSRRAKHGYAGIHVGFRRACGFRFCEILFYRNPEAPRQVTWIFAWRNCAKRSPEARRKSTCARVVAFFMKNKTFAAISAHEFAHELAPLMLKSCLSTDVAWIEEFDA